MFKSMSGDNVDKVTKWLKASGTAFIIISGVFAATALDDGFGTSRDIKRSVYTLAGSIAGIGWILLATGLSWHPESIIVWKSVSVWILIASIAASSTFAFWYRLGDLGVPVSVNVAYVVSWFLLAGAVAVTRKGASVEVDSKKLALSMCAAVLITSGNLLVYPWERSSCLTEGPGQAMVFAGWLILVSAS